jgi:hypothetical protein
MPKIGMPKIGMPKIGMPKGLEGTKYFWILLGTTIFGLGLSIYWTLSNEYVPINKNTIFHNGTDLDVIMTAENYTNVPLSSFLNPKIANVTVEVYYKTLPLFLKGVKLSSNGSSILTTKNETFETLVPVKKAPKAPTAKSTAANYTVRLEMGHPLEVGNYSDQYAVNLFYRKTFDNGSIIVEKVPFTWQIKTLDWSKLSKFWIIFAGVLFSRMFKLGDKSGIGFAFKPVELIWVPFSAIITILIFNSFVEQVKPTTNVLLNLALTFGFGFGFDKVLETWQKSPTFARNGTQTKNSSPEK